MRAFTHQVVALLSFASLVAVGCSTSRDESTASQASAAKIAAPAPAVDARAVLLAGGEFRFVFDESPEVFAKVTKRCAAEADAAKCVQAVREEGAREGLRFIPVDADHTRMESFASEEGRSVVILEASFAIARVEGARVHVTTTAPLKALNGPKDPKYFDSVPIEVIDADTIAQFDTQKGKLVFRRAPVR